MPSTVLYLLTKTDGSNAFVIQPETFDGAGGVQRHTDLTLYGNGAPNWGERFDDNFYHLLENFATPELNGTLFVPKTESILGDGNGINKPIPGQTWFNQTRDQLFMYRGPGKGSQGWAPTTSALAVSAPTPTTLSGLPYVPHVGDLVFDTSASSLKVFNGSTWQNSAGNVVTSLIAGTGITLSGSTGDVTISTSGFGTVTSVNVVGSTGLNVSGAPITSSGTIALTLGTELQALSLLSATGLLARTGGGSYVARAITSGSGIVVTNGTGLTGNPIVSLGIVPISNGGTGQTNAGPAFNALAPAGPTGTLIVRNQFANYVAFPAGTEGQVLTAAPSSNPSIGVKWANLSSAFNHSTTADGYEILPSGLILQWGSVSAVHSGTPIDFGVQFPIAFPTRCVYVGCTTDRSVAASGQAIDGSNFASNIGTVPPITACVITLDAGPGGITSGRWFAIGF